MQQDSQWKIEKKEKKNQFAILISFGSKKIQHSSFLDSLLVEYSEKYSALIFIAIHPLFRHLLTITCAMQEDSVNSQKN